MSPATAYKILTAPQWAAWQESGLFAGAPVDIADGFIHLSAADQVAGTREKHFAGQSGLVLAEIDLASLGAAVKWKSRAAARFSRMSMAASPLPRSRTAPHFRSNHSCKGVFGGR